MGVTLKASSTSASAPDVEDGLFLARFDGLAEKVLAKSQFDPEVFEWTFTLLTDEGAVMYDDGEPIELTPITSRSLNPKSKTVPKALRYLKGVLTPVEYAAFEAAIEDETDPGLDSEKLVGRVVQVMVEKNANGWPTIIDVIAATKAQKALVEKAAAA